MITLLLIIIVFQLSAIGYLLERSLYSPYIKRQEILRIEVLQKQWEEDRKKSREKAKEFNQIK